MKKTRRVLAAVAGVVAVMATGLLCPVGGKADYNPWACNPQGYGEPLVFGCVAVDTQGDIDACATVNSGLTPEPCFQTGPAYPDPYPSNGLTCNAPPGPFETACAAVVVANPSVAACASGIIGACASGPEPGALNPDPVVVDVAMGFTSICGSGCYTYNIWIDCKVGNEVSNLTGCYMEGSGTLHITAAECTGASLTGSLTFYSPGKASRQFNITGAVFADQLAIQGSGNQSLDGTLSLEEYCAIGTPPQNGYYGTLLSGYAYGTV